ncbi:hypothetical protein QJS10_CPA06g00666 [Acorus calamus]|uniref:Uncharacterized protein n=1 Tax=Acorus calamus TaxID=4465 RepID=A0AAV9EHY4_ACOCL|nr:hypothetical protein QJS10_CPA06g00666 [Acorus calamus]
MKDSFRDFGMEALEEIMSCMIDGNVSVIFAGYTEPMNRVICANEDEDEDELSIQILKQAHSINTHWKYINNTITTPGQPHHKITTAQENTHLEKLHKRAQIKMEHLDRSYSVEELMKQTPLDTAIRGPPPSTKRSRNILRLRVNNR